MNCSLRPFDAALVVDFAEGHFDTVAHALPEQRQAARERPAHSNLHRILGTAGSAVSASTAPAARIARRGNNLV